MKSIVLLFLSALAAHCQTYTYTLAAPADSAPGLPSANLTNTDGSTIYFTDSYIITPEGRETVAQVTIYPLSMWFDAPETITQTAGTATCNASVKAGMNYFTLTIPEATTTDSQGRSVTVSASYELTNFYAPGRYPSCHYEFLSGALTVTLN